MRRDRVIALAVALIAIGTGALAGRASLAGLILACLVFVLLVAVLLPGGHANSTVPWWMHPTFALLVATVPGLILAISLPESYFLEQWSSPKYVSTDFLLLSGGLIAAFGLGAQAAMRVLTGKADTTAASFAGNRDVQAKLETSARILFWVTAAGYVLWLGIGIIKGLRPADMAAVVSGAAGAVSETKSAYLQPVAGVTTLTQFGPLAVVCLMLLRWMDSHIRWRWYIGALFVLALLRTLLYAERLALVELVVPIVVLAIALPTGKAQRPWRRPAITLLPLWAPVAVLVFFGSFEYLRSWSTYYRDASAGQSYAAFTANRLGAYYATAVNNSVVLLRSDRRATEVPYYVLAGFWNFPGVDIALSYERVSGQDVAGTWLDTLDAEANPEFNNTGGILVPVYDLGTVGAFVFWLVAGFAVGAAFRAFKERRLVGLLAFPVLFIGLLEGGRLLYWPQGRALPSIVAALIIASTIAGRSTGRRVLMTAGRASARTHADRGKQRVRAYS